MWLSRVAEKRIHFLMTLYGIRCSADVLSSPESAFSCEFCQEVEAKDDDEGFDDSTSTSQDESIEGWEP